MHNQTSSHFLQPPCMMAGHHTAIMHKLVLSTSACGRGMLPGYPISGLSMGACEGVTCRSDDGTFYLLKSKGLHALSK